jgi:hypothetical protein
MHAKTRDYRYLPANPDSGPLPGFQGREILRFSRSNFKSEATDPIVKYGAKTTFAGRNRTDNTWKTSLYFLVRPLSIAYRYLRVF